MQVNFHRGIDGDETWQLGQLQNIVGDIHGRHFYERVATAKIKELLIAGKLAGDNFWRVFHLVEKLDQAL